MITKRMTQDVSQQEQQIFGKACDDHMVVIHGADGERNILALGEYLIVTWGVVVTPETVGIAVQKLKEAGRMSFYTPVQARYYKIAGEDPKRAEALNAWVQSSANKILTKGGDDNDLANQTALLAELRGRDLRDIYDAIGRLGNRGLLHYAPVQRKADPRAHKDSEPFMPKDGSDRSIIGGRKNHAFSVEIKPLAAPNSSEKDAWTALNEQLLHHGTHSQQAAMKTVYDKGQQAGKSPRQIYSDLSELKRSYERVTSLRGV